MSSRFSKLTYLHILEMFTSIFNSQETIEFLQSFAQKFLGSFVGTVAMANKHEVFKLHSQGTSLLYPVPGQSKCPIIGENMHVSTET